MTDWHNKVTIHESYNAHSKEASEYAKDEFWQFELIKEALFEHIKIEGARHLFSGDLRNRNLIVSVSEDGLSVTVSEAG
jgi:hypothetical protein